MEYDYPKNLGCKRVDPNGTLCATIGCWTKDLLDNSKDLGDNPEATKRREEIIKAAKAAGCKCDLTPYV